MVLPRSGRTGASQTSAPEALLHAENTKPSLFGWLVHGSAQGKAQNIPGIHWVNHTIIPETEEDHRVRRDSIKGSVSQDSLHTQRSQGQERAQRKHAVFTHEAPRHRQNLPRTSKVRVTFIIVFGPELIPDLFLLLLGQLKEEAHPPTKSLSA